MMWKSDSSRKRRRQCAVDDEEEERDVIVGLYVYALKNHVYFNADVTSETMFRLCKELRIVAHRMQKSKAMHQQPMYLHVSTSGGDVSAAFSCVDCIKSLGIPVYSVVDGFVASAGTLITLAAEKRYIQPNAYMLIHQVSSGVWGKMSIIHEQVGNLKKVMEHLTEFYLKHTKLKAKVLNQLLLTDVEWNATECIAKGIVDELYPRQL
jgi:ATP-dependent Clp protease, protease subunit